MKHLLMSAGGAAAEYTLHILHTNDMHSRVESINKYDSTCNAEGEAEFMEQMGYDAVAVGNHEFDDGPEGLSAFVDMVSFPVISGNLDLSSSDMLKDKAENHVVLEVGGRKIGVISALATDTVETSSPGPDVVFQDEVEALAADVATLKAEGVDMIIALNHVGLSKDLTIAEAVPGIDVVIGGGGAQPHVDVQ